MSQIVASVDLKEELFELVKHHVDSGVPFPAETAELFDRVSNMQLHQAFSKTRVHDVLSAPPEDCVEEARKADKRVRELHDMPCVNLAWLTQGRLLRGTRAMRPTCAWFLTVLRRAWTDLIRYLPDATKLRLRNIIQVQMTPHRVRREMQTRYAMTFQVDGYGIRVPPDPVPLHRVNAVWVFFVPGRGDELRPRVAEAPLAYNPETRELIPVGPREYDLGLVPEDRPRSRSCLRTDQITLIEGAHACHEALEFASVTGLNMKTRLTLPDSHVVVTDPANYGNGDLNLVDDPTPDFESALKDHFNQWWRCDKDPARAREQLAVKYAGRPYPYMWLDLLATTGDQLHHVAPSWESARAQLGDEAEAFAWGVFLALWKPFAGGFILPATLMPVSFGDPFQGADAFATVPSQLMGRTCYADGNVTVDYSTVCPQVIDVAAPAA